jgi:uncharacterized protein (DUF1800 family)
LQEGNYAHEDAGALAAVLGLAVFPGFTAYAKKKNARQAASFTVQIPKQERVLHAINRLTFGPRPGDAGRVASIGLKQWIELQLHPERIEESAVLAGKLAHFDTLRMSSLEIVERYPPPQLLRAMVDGRVPYPSDPDRRRSLERQAKAYKARQEGTEPDLPKLADVLTPEQARVFRSGTPREKMDLIESLPPAKQEDIVAALPKGARAALFQAASPGLRRRMESMAGTQQVVAQDLSQAKLFRAIYSNRQLQEVLADFWYNHFNVFLDKGADRYLVTEYDEQVIRPRVLGRFRDLVLETAKSPAMLFYLDNWQSVGPVAPVAKGRRGAVAPRVAARGLNENYGRELLELHTLGVDGGYTQKDVTEVARCFTGWTIRDPRRGGVFEFNPRMHDAGEKTVLGVTIPAGGGMEDGLKVIDIVARHPSTARFLSRKLAQRFVADEPPPALIDRMAAAFQKTDGDIRAVLSALFESKEFWSVGAHRSKMKSPFELVASAVRATGGEVQYAQALVQQVAQLGQPLYRKSEPTGYSNAGQEWLNSAGLLARMNFAVQLAENRLPGVKVETAAGTTDQASLGSPEFQRK